MSLGKILQSSRGRGREALARVIASRGYTSTSLARALGNAHWRGIVSQWVCGVSSPSEQDQERLAEILKIDRDTLDELLDDPRSDVFESVALASPIQIGSIRRYLGLRQACGSGES